MNLQALEQERREQNNAIETLKAEAVSVSLTDAI